MRHLYLLRHGEADHPAGSYFRDDSERPLTEEGRRKMAEEAAGLVSLRIRIDAIVTSPFVRTRETAEIIALAYGLESEIVEARELEPGASLTEIRQVVRRSTGTRVLLVGHAPDLGEAVGELADIEAVTLGKGWLAWLALSGSDVKRGSATLLALFPARVLRNAGERSGRVR